jgi:hypothetical protein
VLYKLNAVDPYSLKAPPGFNPRTRNVLSWFQQAFAFKWNLYRYITGSEVACYHPAGQLPSGLTAGMALLVPWTIFLSGHQLMTPGMVRVTNLTPGSGVKPRRAYGRGHQPVWSI